MSSALEAVAVFLLLTLALGLLRIWRGPTSADRMLSAQLFGTTGVALLLVLAQLQEMPALLDVALVLVVLAVMASAAYAARIHASSAGTDEDSQRGP